MFYAIIYLISNDMRFPFGVHGDFVNECGIVWVGVHLRNDIGIGLEKEIWMVQCRMRNPSTKKRGAGGWGVLWLALLKVKEKTKVFTM